MRGMRGKQPGGGQEKSGEVYMAGKHSAKTHNDLGRNMTLPHKRASHVRYIVLCYKFFDHEKAYPHVSLRTP